MSDLRGAEWIDIGAYMYTSVGMPVDFGRSVYSAKLSASCADGDVKCSIPCFDDDGVTPTEVFCEVFYEKGQFAQSVMPTCGQ